jgi:hypothetical protein
LTSVKKSCTFALPIARNGESEGQKEKEKQRKPAMVLGSSKKFKINFGDADKVSTFAVPNETGKQSD